MLSKLRFLFSSQPSVPAKKRRSLLGNLTLESLELRAAPAAMGSGAVADTSSSSSSQSSVAQTAQISTSGSSQSSSGQSSLSSVDRATLTHQAQGDQQEIILGSIAMQNSSNASVRAYGAELVTDHTHDLTTLLPILQQNGMSLPALSSDNLQVIQSLGALHGSQFDQQFLSYMVQDHVEDISLSLQELSQGSNMTVQNETLASLPMLESHLSTAFTLEEQLNQQSSSSQNGSQSGATGLQNGSAQNGTQNGSSENSSSSQTSSQNSSAQGNSTQDSNTGDSNTQDDSNQSTSSQNNQFGSRW